MKHTKLYTTLLACLCVSSVHAAITNPLTGTETFTGSQTYDANASLTVNSGAVLNVGSESEGGSLTFQYNSPTTVLTNSGTINIGQYQTSSGEF